MGTKSVRVSLIMTLIAWTVYVDITVGDCLKDRHKLVPAGVCDAAEYDDDFDFKNFRFPTPGCYHYDDSVIQSMSFTSTSGRDADIATGDNIEMRCEAESKTKNDVFIMWLCRRSSETLLVKCLCPSTASIKRGAKYTIQFEVGEDSKKLRLNHTLQNVTHNATDLYFCLVQVGLSDRLVHGFGAINIDVRDVSKPEISIGPRNVSVELGEEAVLTCKARGFPEVSYLWLKNGDYLNGTHSTRLLSWETSINSYYINVTSREDEGVYTCVASNSVGNVTSEGAFLEVLETDQPTAASQKNSQNINPWIPIGCVAGAVVLAVVAIVIGIVVHKWIGRKKQLLKQETANVTIDKRVETNTFIVKAGDNASITFNGDVNVGGRHLANRIEESTGSKDIEEGASTPNSDVEEHDQKGDEQGDENQILRPLMEDECGQHIKEGARIPNMHAEQQDADDGKRGDENQASVRADCDVRDGVNETSQKQHQGNERGAMWDGQHPTCDETDSRSDQDLNQPNESSPMMNWSVPPYGAKIPSSEARNTLAS